MLGALLFGTALAVTNKVLYIGPFCLKDCATAKAAIVTKLQLVSGASTVDSTTCGSYSVPTAIATTTLPEIAAANSCPPNALTTYFRQKGLIDTPADPKEAAALASQIISGNYIDVGIPMRTTVTVGNEDGGTNAAAGVPVAAAGTVNVIALGSQFTICLPACDGTKVTALLTAVTAAASVAANTAISSGCGAVCSGGAGAATVVVTISSPVTNVGNIAQLSGAIRLGNLVSVGVPTNTVITGTTTAASAALPVAPLVVPLATPAQTLVKTLTLTVCFTNCATASLAAVKAAVDVAAGVLSGTTQGTCPLATATCATAVNGTTLVLTVPDLTADQAKTLISNIAGGNLVSVGIPVVGAEITTGGAVFNIVTALNAAATADSNLAICVATAACAVGLANAKAALETAAGVAAGTATTTAVCPAGSGTVPCETGHVSFAIAMNGLTPTQAVALQTFLTAGVATGTSWKVGAGSVTATASSAASFTVTWAAAAAPNAPLALPASVPVTIPQIVAGVSSLGVCVLNCATKLADALIAINKAAGLAAGTATGTCLAVACATDSQTLSVSFPAGISSWQLQNLQNNIAAGNLVSVGIPTTGAIVMNSPAGAVVALAAPSAVPTVPVVPSPTAVPTVVVPGVPTVTVPGVPTVTVPTVTVPGVPSTVTVPGVPSVTTPSPAASPVATPVAPPSPSTVPVAVPVPFTVTSPALPVTLTPICLDDCSTRLAALLAAVDAAAGVASGTAQGTCGTGTGCATRRALLQAGAQSVIITLPGATSAQAQALQNNIAAGNLVHVGIAPTVIVSAQTPDGTPIPLAPPSPVPLAPSSPNSPNGLCFTAASATVSKFPCAVGLAACQDLQLKLAAATPAIYSQCCGCTTVGVTRRALKQANFQLVAAAALPAVCAVLGAGAAGCGKQSKKGLLGLLGLLGLIPLFLVLLLCCLCLLRRKRRGQAMLFSVTNAPVAGPHMHAPACP